VTRECFNLNANSGTEFTECCEETGAISEMMPSKVSKIEMWLIQEAAASRANGSKCAISLRTFRGCL
jgi:hypothetical protein